MHCSGCSVACRRKFYIGHYPECTHCTQHCQARPSHTQSAVNRGIIFAVYLDIDTYYIYCIHKHSLKHLIKHYNSTIPTLTSAIAAPVGWSPCPRPPASPRPRAAPWPRPPPPTARPPTTAPRPAPRRAPARASARAPTRAGVRAHVAARGLGGAPRCRPAACL